MLPLDLSQAPPAPKAKLLAGVLLGGGGSLMLIGLLVLRCKRWSWTRTAPLKQEGRRRKRRARHGRARGMERAAGSEVMDDDMFELNDAARAAVAADAGDANTVRAR